MYRYHFQMKGESVFWFEWDKFNILDEGVEVGLPVGNFNIKTTLEADHSKKMIVYDVEPLLNCLYEPF